jgi:hypothetical protein
MRSSRPASKSLRSAFYHVIAESNELARAFYERRWGSPYQRHTLLGVALLFVIDGEIGVENK